MSSLSSDVSGSSSTCQDLDPSLALQSRYESFNYNDGVVRAFVLATIFWAFIGLVTGLGVQLLLLKPTLAAESFPGMADYLSFGRLQPLFINLMVYGFIANGMFAGIYYSLQRLCKCRLWSGLLGALHFFGWQAIVAAAVVTLPLGISQGKELAELEWPIDVAIAVTWWLFFGGNVFVTLLKRRERYLYVSLWFYIATIVLVGIYHIISSVVIPLTLAKSYPIYGGVQDALVYWFYGRNVVDALVLLPFLGMMYYFVPKTAEKPLYSYQLSIVQFWSLTLIMCFAGLRHLHYSPIPEWVSTLGMVFGVVMWMPAWGGLINGMKTLGGPGKKVSSDPVLLFFFAALLFYGVGTLESSLLSIKSVNASSYYTEWWVAHQWLMTLGWASMMTCGAFYWMLPRIFHCTTSNTSLARIHFGLALVGVLMWIAPLYLAGFYQSIQWNQIDNRGQLVNVDFIQILTSVSYYWWISLVGMVIYLVGMVVMFVGYLSASTGKKAATTYSNDSVLHYRHTAAAPVAVHVSVLKEAPVLEFAKSFDSWTRLHWHKLWERRPGRIAVVIAAAAVIASVIEVLPVFVIPGNVPKIETVQPYTPLELIGRDIYIAEGCQNCHSQMIRPLVAEVKRFGQFSKSGEFVYDHPELWGTRRIGRDLAREGGRQSSLWHLQNLEKPTTNTPGSLMPSYQHLLVREVDLSNVGGIVLAANLLGEGDLEAVKIAPELARKQAEEVAAEIISQGGPIIISRTKMNPKGALIESSLPLADTQAIALIAYLQRIGVDLFKTPVAAEPATTDAPATGGSASTGG